MYEGELRAALDRFEKARELAAAPGLGPMELAETLFRLACCRYKLSSIGIAISLFDEALKLVEESGLPGDRLRVDILGWRSRCHRRQRDWVSAKDDVERALELSQALADPELEANTLFQASLICEREGNWLRARRLAEQARALYEQLDDRVNVGRQLNNLGGFEFLLGNSAKAIERLRQAHELACQIGSTPDAAQALCSLAEVELSEQQHTDAEEHARAALALLDGRDDFLDVIGTAQLRLGKALLAQGSLDDAEAAPRRGGDHARTTLVREPSRRRLERPRRTRPRAQGPDRSGATVSPRHRDTAGLPLLTKGGEDHYAQTRRTRSARLRPGDRHRRERRSPWRPGPPPRWRDQPLRRALDPASAPARSERAHACIRPVLVDGR